MRTTFTNSSLNNVTPPQEMQRDKIIFMIQDVLIHIIFLFSVFEYLEKG